MDVVVAGDSLGFTAAYPVPGPDVLPPSIRSVRMQAFIGCGVLAANGFRAHDVAEEGARSETCGPQLATEQAALAARADWMVFFSGGWEHLAWTAPDGRVLAPRSPELRHELVFALVRRAEAAAAHGVRTAFVAWVCPAGVAPTRTGEYSHWYNAILRDAASRVPSAEVVEPTQRLCVGGDAGGAPTPEKAAAFTDHHPRDQRWVWQEWLGPWLDARR